MDYLYIAGWNHWQTYRSDRGTPPWIKIHRQLMTSTKWAGLTDSEKGQLVSIWIAAADKQGRIPADPRVVGKICMLDDSPNLNKFIDLGYLSPDRRQLDATVTPQRRQSDAPETETETETETEKKDHAPDASAPAPPSFWKTEGLETEFLAFKKMRRSIKAPLNEVAESRLIVKLEKMKAEGVDIREAINRSIENCWKGVFAPGGDDAQSKRQGNGNGSRAALGETPADRNRRATEEYLRRRDSRAMAANE